ncbi:hypothetical protein AVEN_229097-1 [Araneus ventricosus]|uniref:Uncharacterized protein n=1 Tax=Araneus ventricosus TaxID=182803 RepID=A0A4Y2M8Q5_ARAVE|nr:hypothetical protein AVEN_229097-1 [Araneus ventricosus]
MCNVVTRKAVHDLDGIGRCEDTRLDHRAVTLLVGCGDPSRFFVVEREPEAVSRLIIFRIQLLGSRSSRNCWKCGCVSQINLLLDWV